MSARRAFLRKEILEYLRTWRIWLLVLPVVVFALVGPTISYLTTELTDYDLVAEAGKSLPDWFAAYSQWTYNLRQVLPVLLVLIAGSTVAVECSSGTAIPILAGGLSRRDFVLLKFAVATGMAIAVSATGTLIVHIFSMLIYDHVPAMAPFAVIWVASLLSTLLISMALFLSTFMGDVFGALGIELFLFLALTGATLWEPARKYSPVGLLTSLSDIVKYNEFNVLIPSVSSILFSALLVLMAVSVFERREL